MTQRTSSESRSPDVKSAHRFVRAAMAGGVVAAVALATGRAAIAQESPLHQSPSPQNQTSQNQTSQTQAAPVAAPCSGVLCLFRSGDAPKPEQAAQTSPPVDQAATATPTETSPADTGPNQATKPKPARPTITIAADSTEIGRVKSLAVALPKEKVKVVTGAREPADFSVRTTLDTPAGTKKARLFTEQMHIVAGPGVATIADLKDKIVSFGPEKSTTQAAARTAFAALGVSVKETPLDLDNALDGVSTGDVAAVVLLAPQPVSRLAAVSGLHLVSWPDAGPLPAGASAASIDGSAYPGLAKPGETIRALGVDAVLTLSASGARRPAAKAFLNDLSQHSDALSRRGFDLIKADLETRSTRRVASVDRR